MSVFLSVLLFFSSFSVKANSVTFPSFPAPVEGESSTHYVIVYDEQDNKYELYMPLEIDNIYRIEINHYIGTYYIHIYYPSNVIYYEWQEGMGSWEYIMAYNRLTDVVFDYEQILYSSFDLKYENGDIFFTKPLSRRIYLRR